MDPGPEYHYIAAAKINSLKRVKDICEVRSGIFAQPATNGDILYFQPKHFSEHGKPRPEVHPELQRDKVPTRHFLNGGDILFSAKGSRNFATVFEGGSQAAVASTSFFVLTVLDISIVPEYFAWFLNNPSTQTILKAQAIGTNITSISKAVLEELEIPIPSLETQKAIVQIARLRNTEKQLKQQLEALREKQIQQQILNAIINN